VPGGERAQQRLDRALAGETVDVPDAKALQALGAAMAARLREGDVVLLSGPLGVGKTTFAQGIAQGMGVSGPVTSPTYALVHEYEDGRLPLRHADLYRVEHPDELRAIGLDERVGVDGVWVVEWPERGGGWPPGAIRVEIGVEGEGRRVGMGLTPSVSAP
jgi:tRNA threonylcarbamoyladenosine biosynthesis protein TsaE